MKFEKIIGSFLVCFDFTAGQVISVTVFSGETELPMRRNLSHRPCYIRYGNGSCYHLVGRRYVNGNDHCGPGVQMAGVVPCSYVDREAPRRYI